MAIGHQFWHSTAVLTFGVLLSLPAVWETLEILRHGKKMERSLNLPGLLIVATAVPMVQLPSVDLAQAQSWAVLADASDFPCYMQTSDGRVINLGKLCGHGSQSVASPPAISTVDQKFLQRYRSFLEKRAQGSPAVQSLISQALQNPQAVVQQAKAVCTALRSGQPQLSSDQVGDDLFQTMAPKYYCPELDD